jgi:hypothetical protein
MTDLAMSASCSIRHGASSSGFDRWHQDRIIEARLILAHAPRHRMTLGALAARVLADARQMGGVA